MPEPGLRALVVDDCHDTAATVALLLQSWGHEVAVAHDGPGAVSSAQGFQPHVILLDLGLPKVDGYEVCRRLRQLPALRGTYLVAVTGHGRDEDRRRSREAGFDFHVVKPIDLAALERLLASLGKVGHAPAAPKWC
jgi:CheY-like chemotaxis protein